MTIAAPLQVRVMPTDERKAYLMPHWENWQWDDKSPTQKFGNISVTLDAGKGKIDGDTRKALLETGMHMGVAGLSVTGGDLVLKISGLTAGKHTLATYHNDFRDKGVTDYVVTVDGVAAVKDFKPSTNAANDYDLASTYLTINASADKPVEVRISPKTRGGSVILNGFEIDATDPHRKATKPVPANDDEHADPAAPLQWAAPATAVAHLLYFGTDAAAVAQANQQSPEFKGKLFKSQAPMPALDHMQTYFWRVDEVAKDGTITPGEVWRLRGRFLAFPTAEGYGQFARGGRGGRVIEVTNLNDSGEGSYRAAVEADGPRTVVFRVSGVVFLKSPCIIRNPYITVAGQTAPGDGICLANYSAGLYTHDAIVRYMRVRVGDVSRKAMDGMGLGGSDDSIIDHCSISWAMDEGSSSRGGHNITFQWNIISEMLQHGYHYKAQNSGENRVAGALETHAFAGSISGDIGSYHHNLLAHCTDRNWSLAGGLDQAGKYAGRLDIRNNVVFNWTARTTDGGVKDLNYVNNYYKPLKGQQCVNWLLMLDPINDGWGKEHVYMAGNVMEGFKYDADNWRAYNQNRGEKRSREQLINLVRVNQPLYPSYVKEESAYDAYKRVVAGAGATLPKRDVIDTRIAEEVRDNKSHYIGTKAAEWAKQPGNKGGPNVPGIIDSQNDVHDADDSPVKPWPNYKTYDVPTDTDHDGMPDDWEKAHGLNPNDPADGNGDYNHDGYTNLEKYLNSLTGEYKAK